MNTSATAPGLGLLNFFIADANTDEIICYFGPGDVIDAADFAGRNVTIAAIPTGSDVGSVQLTLDSVTAVENVSPYALFGDSNGDFNGTTGFTSGPRTLQVEIYSGSNTSGTLLDSFDLDFTFGEGAPADPPQTALADAFDHITFQFDGNNNDPDDIAAIPMAALLAKAGGIEGKTTFFAGNNLAEANNASRLPKLDAGVDFAESLGIEAYNYQDDIDATTARLVAILNSGQKVLMIEGGPMEAAYRALEQTDPANYANISLLSHSGWNENRNVVNNPSDPDLEEARTWADIRDDFPVVLIEIRDQNNGNNNDAGFNNRNWDWLDSTSNAVFQQARDIMDLAGTTKKNDPSDAGMLFYALTGEENGTPQDAQTYLENAPPFSGSPPIDPTPTNGTPVATPDSAETEAGVAVFIDVLANDRDPDGDPLTIEIVDQPATGSAIVTGGGISYTPDPGTSGTQTFSYRVLDDQNAASDPVTVSVNVTDTTVPPDPQPVSAYLAFYLADTDSDSIIASLGDGDVIDPALLAGRNVTIFAEHLDDGNPVGSVVLQLGNQIRTENVEPYALFGDSNGNFLGGTTLGEGPYALAVDVFAGNNGNGGQLETFTLQFSVSDSVPVDPTPTNRAPVATQDTAETETGVPVFIDVLANDSDPDGDPLTIEIVDPPSTGSAIVSGGGITFTPAAGTSGLETFSYRVIDDQNTASDAVSVSVNIIDPTPDSVSEYLRFYIADTDTNATITVLEDGDVIDPALLAGRNVTIAADHIDDNSPVGSVVLQMGGQSRTENIEPYALFGDNAGNFYTGSALADGPYTLDVGVYSGDNGGGTELENFSLQFAVGSDPFWM